MSALMAAVANRLTGYRWNRSYKEQVIRNALAFPLDHVVERYRQEEPVAEEFAYEVERELRRYLILCALHPDRRMPMQGPVDKLWHLFITFTHDYARFCQRVAGRFIHHTPDASGGRPARGWRDIRRFVTLYHRTFGHLPPSDIWPATKGMVVAGSASRAVTRDGHNPGGLDYVTTCASVGGHGGCSGGCGGGGCGGGGD